MRSRLQMGPIRRVMGIQKRIDTGHDFRHACTICRFFINDRFPHAHHLHADTGVFQGRPRISKLLQG